MKNNNNNIVHMRRDHTDACEWNRNVSAVNVLLLLMMTANEDHGATAAAAVNHLPDIMLIV